VVRRADALGFGPSELDVRPVGAVLRPGRWRVLQVAHAAACAPVAVLVAVVSGEVWTMLGWNGLAAVLVLVIVWVRLNRQRR
jgi:disulfide bond formation protein DsbB